MKKYLSIFFILFALSCTTKNKSYDDNMGGQTGDRDYPSNRDNEIPDGNADTSVTIKPDNRGTDYDSISEAPNTTDSNNSEGIQGQKGGNQTGK